MARSIIIRGNAGNIRSTLQSATPGQIQRGMSWYRRYRVAVCRAAAEAGYLTGPYRADRPAPDRVRRIMGIAAAFSLQRNPNCNLAAVNKFVRGMMTGTGPAKKCWHSPDADRKALAIWNGADPATVLTGPKERAFYFGGIGDAEQVTIDGHAYAIWLGERITTDKISVPAKGPQREACDADYRAVASEYGINPSDVQAITWVAWRDEHQDEKTKSMRSSGGDWMDD